MTQGPIRVEIVAPVHNRKELTLLCLQSLSRINSTGLDVGIVIVDDGSTDGTSDAIRDQFPSVDIVSGDGELWFTEGTNVGVRRALERDPKYILLMNDDQVFDEDFLVRLVETAERNPRSVVGSLLLLWDTPHKIFQIAPVWSTWHGGWRHWQSQTVWTVPEKPWKVGLIVGNCVLVPTEAMRECGLMNSKRYPNFGDAEYTPRLRKAGWNLIIDPRSRVFCQPNTPPGRIRSMGFKKLFNALFIDLKSFQSLRRRFYAYIDTAPTKLHGFAAFFIFLARAATGYNAETDRWGKAQAEEPLSKTFGSAVLND